MTPEELERMNWLCNRIQEENEPEQFDKLVAELNNHIEAKHEGIAEATTKPDSLCCPLWADATDTAHGLNS